MTSGLKVVSQFCFGGYNRPIVAQSQVFKGKSKGVTTICDSSKRLYCAFIFDEMSRVGLGLMSMVLANVDCCS